MREKPGDEHENRSYQKQLEEIKELCDQSFLSIEETHAKQLDDMAAAHEREIQHLREEFNEQIETDKADTRRAIEAMRK
uniref:Uncharacterized protein n=1 Tax=Ciona savignyi TaxID=51511 RepID=H2YF42_CIOSA